MNKISKTINSVLLNYDIKKDFISSETFSPKLTNRTNVPFLCDLCIEITNMCNFFCKNCFSNQGYNCLPLESIKEILNEYKEKIIRICLSGGEPLLHKNIKEIIQFMNTMDGCGKILSTNGYFITEEIISLLENNNWTVAVSLHGRENTHNCYVRKESYERIIRNIALLKQHNINTHIYTVLHNAFQMEDLFHLIKIRDYYDISLLRLIKVRNAQYGRNESTFCQINISELNKIISKDEKLFYKDEKTDTLFFSVDGELRKTC